MSNSDYKSDVILNYNNTYYHGMLNELSNERISFGSYYSKSFNLESYDIININDENEINSKIILTNNIKLINCIRTIEVSENHSITNKILNNSNIFDYWNSLTNTIKRILFLKEISNLDLLLKLLELTSKNSFKIDILLISNEIILRTSELNINKKGCLYINQLDDKYRNDILQKVFKIMILFFEELNIFIETILSYSKIPVLNYQLNIQLLFDNLYLASIKHINSFYNYDDIHEELFLYISLQTNEKNISYTKVSLLMLILDKIVGCDLINDFNNSFINEIKHEIDRIYRLLSFSNNTIYIYEEQNTYLRHNSYTSSDQDIENQRLIRIFQKSNNINGYFHDYFICFFSCLRDSNEKLSIRRIINFFYIIKNDLKEFKVEDPLNKIPNYKPNYDEPFERSHIIDIDHYSQNLNIAFLSIDFLKNKTLYKSTNDKTFVFLLDYISKLFLLLKKINLRWEYFKHITSK